MNIASTRLSLSLLFASTLAVGCAADPMLDGPTDGSPYSDEGDEGNESIDASEDIESTTEPLLFGDDIGVIKGAGVNCPGAIAPRQLFIDNENTNNNNQQSGWVGDTITGRDTTFQICPLPGRFFAQIRSSNAAHNYAVVRLAPTCPPGSVPFTRYFDGNDNSTGWCEGGDDGRNQSCWGNLTMNFCLFRANPNAPAFGFPNFGASYGVFAAAGLPGSFGSGWRYTDDEDSSNNNSISGDFSGSQGFLQTSFSNGGTRLHMAKVQP